MRNHRSQPTPRRWRTGLFAAGVVIAALGPAAGIASAAGQPSALSVTFTGQTGTSSWSANALTVDANAATTDASNPVQKVVCSVDQGASTTTIGSQQKVPVTGNGAHLVACYPIAWDGTQGATQFATVQIDDQLPTVALSGVSTSPAWNNGSATITATATEPQALAGIQSVTCLDGAGGKTVTAGNTGSITVSGTQRYSVSCYATTAAGVIGSRTYESVWMDNTAPEITYINAPDPAQWYSTGQPVEVDVQTPVGAAPIQSLSCDYAGQPVLGGGQLTEQAPAALHNWSVAVTLPGSGSGALNCFATDVAANVSGVSSITQQVDTTPPTGVFDSGPTNPTVIVAKVADNLSGVYGANIQYEQNGAWVTLPTTLTGGTARAVVPADNPISVGKHPLRVIVTDNADNQYVGYNTQSGTQAILDYPVAAGLRLLYTIAPTGRDVDGHLAANTATNSTVHLAYRQAAVISGRLDSTARSLVANEPVTITVRLADGQHYAVSVRTNRLGVWRYRLPAGGDRTVKITFGGTVGLRTQTHRITVRNRAAIRVAFHLAGNGQIILTAHVLGGELPAHGLGLIAQWRRGADSPWQTFPRMQTGANGRVSARLPLVGVSPGSRIQIRVTTPAARGWGYVGAFSPILTTQVA